MFVSLDKITIPVAEEFNVRTGKAQGPLSGICLTNDHLWEIRHYLFFLLLVWLERGKSNA